MQAETRPTVAFGHSFHCPSSTSLSNTFQNPDRVALDGEQGEVRPMPVYAGDAFGGRAEVGGGSLQTSKMVNKPLNGRGTKRAANTRFR